MCKFLNVRVSSDIPSFRLRLNSWLTHLQRWIYSSDSTARIQQISTLEHPEHLYTRGQHGSKSLPLNSAAVGWHFLGETSQGKILVVSQCTEMMNFHCKSNIQLLFFHNQVLPSCISIHTWKCWHHYKVFGDEQGSGILQIPLKGFTKLASISKMCLNKLSHFIKICFLSSGSSEHLMEGNLVFPKTKNALYCLDNNCFWNRNSSNLVQVPYILSSEYCKWIVFSHWTYSFNSCKKKKKKSCYFYFFCLFVYLFAASTDISVIQNDMSTFHNKTCIRFVPRLNQTDYISIENKDEWGQLYCINIKHLIGLAETLSQHVAF